MEQTIEHYLASVSLPQNLKGLELITALQQAHISQFSFSSVNVLLGRELPTDIPTLFERLVVNKQGGYCFEHNKLFEAVLTQLGFDVRPLIGKVVLDGNFSNGRSHRVTLVNLNDKKYIVDVGFGISNPQIPFLVDPDNKQVLEAAHYHVQKQSNGMYLLQQKLEHKVQPFYLFDLAQYSEADCDIGHFYSHRYPEATFVNHLVVSRVCANQRYLIRNLTYSQLDHQLNALNQQQIDSSDMLQQLLHEVFEINISTQQATQLFNHQQQKLLSMEQG